MEHTVEFQNGAYDGVSEWSIWWSFRMEHMAEFQNGAYGGVSEWSIWWSYRMEHMVELQNGTYGGVSDWKSKSQECGFPKKRLMCLFTFTWHMATPCFDQAARLQETLKTK